MRRILLWTVGLLGLPYHLSARAADPPQFEFQDGDRVVLLGDALIERDQKYGYLETLLTIEHPDKNITFRNLGWSGDTVRGTARAFFGTEADGFKHLKEHVLALKPTVILVGYGMADSFDGEAGLPRFVSGLNTLLDVLAETKARIVLISPIAMKDLYGTKLPRSDSHNRLLRFYVDAISAVARERGYPFLDLFRITSAHSEHSNEPKLTSAPKLTDDQMHLNEHGSWRFAPAVAAFLDSEPGVWQVDLFQGQTVSGAYGTKIQKLEDAGQGVRWESTDKMLPPPPPPAGTRDAASWTPARVLRVRGLAPGQYTLKIDGRVAEKATHLLWGQGVRLTHGPEYDQVERLRGVINEKNLLYFHRWRPQNETYLFGFRKHEQGNNAREIPLFEPLVEEKEKEIAKLKKPVPHVYELVRESEVTK